MAEAGYSNRWWESYLIRYFIPSIAGIAIVSWLLSISGNDELKRILFFGLKNTPDVKVTLNSETLILLILYGNLFCYVASYPILVFHATRVIDFQKRGVWKFLMSYYVALLLFVFLIVVFWLPPCFAIFKTIYSAFTLALLFAMYQLWRICCALQNKSITNGNSKNTLAFEWTLKLAKQRVGNDDANKSLNKEANKDIIETYRHLREHGNSAFIFFLELILASLCYLILSDKTLVADLQLPTIGILFGIWAIPGVFTHYLAQHIENDFSKYSTK